MEKKLMNEIFHDYVFEFYRKMKINQINLIYEGEVTHQITKAFTALTEENMAKDAEPNSLQMRVFHIIVESLQNISKHAQNLKGMREDMKGIGTFLIAKSITDYFIIAGNLLHNDDKAQVQELIDRINELDKEGLKKLHKEQMKQGKLSERGGAGLGFIDIARKSGKPLSYEFRPITDDTSFFILTTQIQRTKNAL
jgi:hypothetical protein